MSYRKINFHHSEKEIIQELITSAESLLLIPPYYEGRNPVIGHPPTDRKYIGLFSSGTTDRPKCVWNSFDHLKLNALYTAKAFRMTGRDRLLILAKPWHVAGLSWALMAGELGCEYRFVTTHRGEESQWYDAIRSFKPTAVLTVPPVLRGLYDKPWKADKIIFGGIPALAEDLQALGEHCKEMIQGYGMTEAGGLITAYSIIRGEAIPEYAHLCCGKAIEGVEVRCIGTVKKPAEIFIRSATAYKADWLGTGDIGFLDDEARLYLTGRVFEGVKEDKF